MKYVYKTVVTPSLPSVQNVVTNRNYNCDNIELCDDIPIRYGSESYLYDAHMDYR